MGTSLLTLILRSKRDILLARQRARQVAGLLGYKPRDQAVIAAAVFEISWDAFKQGGKKAVQGHCLEPLLARWVEHPYLTRKPPKAVHPDAFGKAFLLAAFDSARQLGAGELLARELRGA